MVDGVRGVIKRRVREYNIMSVNYVQEVRRRLSEKIDVEMDLLSLYALLVFTRGDMCTNEDIHDAWAIWRDRTNPEHKSLIPFEELSQEVKDLDIEYCEAVREVAREIGV